MRIGLAITSQGLHCTETLPVLSRHTRLRAHYQARICGALPAAEDEDAIPAAGPGGIPAAGSGNIPQAGGN